MHPFPYGHYASNSTPNSLDRRKPTKPAKPAAKPAATPTSKKPQQQVAFSAAAFSNGDDEANAGGGRRQGHARSHPRSGRKKSGLRMNRRNKRDQHHRVHDTDTAQAQHTHVHQTHVDREWKAAHKNEQRAVARAMRPGFDGYQQDRLSPGTASPAGTATMTLSPATRSPSRHGSAPYHSAGNHYGQMMYM